MTEHSTRTFVFPAELGRRLQLFHKRAGLSLAVLAHVMGRKPGFVSWLSELERGLPVRDRTQTGLPVPGRTQTGLSRA